MWARWVASIWNGQQTSCYGERTDVDEPHSRGRAAHVLQSWFSSCFGDKISSYELNEILDSDEHQDGLREVRAEFVEYEGMFLELPYPRSKLASQLYLKAFYDGPKDILQVALDTFNNVGENFNYHFLTWCRANDVIWSIGFANRQNSLCPKIYYFGIWSVSDLGV